MWWTGPWHGWPAALSRRQRQGLETEAGAWGCVFRRVSEPDSAQGIQLTSRKPGVGTVSLIPWTMWQAGPVLVGGHTKVNQTQAWPSSGSQMSFPGWAERSFQYSFTCAALLSASQPLHSASVYLALTLEDRRLRSASSAWSLASGCVCVIYDPVTLQVTACLLSGIVSHMIKLCHLIHSWICIFE